MFQRDAPAAGASSSQPPAAQPSAGSSTQPELPPYTLVKKTKDYSLRLYDVYPVVQMEYQRREEGYAALGSYFDGANADKARFSYTHPVVMTYQPDGQKTMSMHIGTRRGAGGSAGAAREALSSLPAPSEPYVSLGVSGGELVAVFQFDGFITPATAEAARRALLSALERDGVKVAEEDAAGRFRVGQFGAVYSLGPRLNEMMIRVQV